MPENNLPFAYYDMGAPIDEEVSLRCNAAGVPEPIIHSGRRSGNTTRLVDYYIQMLFKTGKAEVIDHTQVPNHGGLPYIVQIITQRLQREHRLDNRNFTVDNKGTITLKDFKG